MRIGIGYDAHRLTEGRKLIIGGVDIPFDKGLAGHSDADVLIHAVMDAMLGAAGMGDIGMLFPDTDEKFRGISSVALLKEVSNAYKSRNLAIVNIDAVIVAQSPKLSVFFPLMKSNIADALGIDSCKINMKAKTEEGMGFTGLGEGMAAHAVCLIDYTNIIEMNQ